jgi:hypothetical protein
MWGPLRQVLATVALVLRLGRHDGNAGTRSTNCKAPASTCLPVCLPVCLAACVPAPNRSYAPKTRSRSSNWYDSELLLLDPVSLCLVMTLWLFLFKLSVYSINNQYIYSCTCVYQSGTSYLAMYRNVGGVLCCCVVLLCCGEERVHDGRWLAGGWVGFLNVRSLRAFVRVSNVELQCSPKLFEMEL